MEHFKSTTIGVVAVVTLALAITLALVATATGTAESAPTVSAKEAVAVEETVERPVENDPVDEMEAVATEVVEELGNLFNSIFDGTGSALLYEDDRLAFSEGAERMREAASEVDDSNDRKAGVLGLADLYTELSLIESPTSTDHVEIELYGTTVHALAAEITLHISLANGEDAPAAEAALATAQENLAAAEAAAEEVENEEPAPRKTTTTRSTSRSTSDYESKRNTWDAFYDSCRSMSDGSWLECTELTNEIVGEL